MGRSLRIALLSYRSKPHSGGQGIYVRALSRELSELGHRVEVLSGQPYPELDPGVPLTRVPSLDLYREPDPFRTPRPAEFRDWVDVAEWATMCTAGFPEPLTFSLRAARLLTRRTADFDVVHDNQSLGYGLLADRALGTADRRDRAPSRGHRPPAGTRRRPRRWRRRLTLRRWYAFTRMQATVVRRLDAVTTVSESSRRDIERHMGRPAGRGRRHPRRHRRRGLHPASAGRTARATTRSWSSPAPTCRSRAWCTCWSRSPSCARSGRCG